MSGASAIALPLSPGETERFIENLVDALADRIAAKWSGGAHDGSPEVVGAAALAKRIGASAQWVRDHAEELGGWRLGNGPKAPYRFDVDRAERSLRGSGPERRPLPPPERDMANARRRHMPGTSGLLPVRGDDPT